MKPKVSIIVPIYNVELYLKRCVESLLHQTLQEIEIILIDDASPDKCGEICDDYAKQDNRVIVIHKENEGLGLSRNVGIKIAKGEYLAFVDSDDYIDKGAYQKMYENAKNNQSDICYCGVKFLNKKGKEKLRLENPFEKEIFCHDEVIEDILYNILLADTKDKATYGMGAAVWKAIYAKRIFEENKILFCSERKFISEDYIFDLDYIPKCNKISFEKDIFYYHCDNNDSLTGSYKKDRFEKNKILKKEMLKKAKEIGIAKQVEIGLENLFMQSVRHCISQEVANKEKIKKDKINRIQEIIEDKDVQKAVSKEQNTTKQQQILNEMIQKKNADMIYRLEKMNHIIKKVRGN